jgi:hypothetical protein
MMKEKNKKNKKKKKETAPFDYRTISHRSVWGSSPRVTPAPAARTLSSTGCAPSRAGTASQQRAEYRTAACNAYANDEHLNALRPAGRSRACLDR